MVRGQTKHRPSRRQVVQTYDYRDEEGRIRYRLVRYFPKDFAFLRPDGRPWTNKRRRRLLYRLPELLAADSSETVYIVEGEKDVEQLRSLGLIATCNDNGGGQGKWSLSHSRPLAGRRVVILPDNDTTGSVHADDIARKLQRTVREQKIVKLPGLPRKGDVSDWLETGGTVEKLAQICASAPTWRRPPPEFGCYVDLHDERDATWLRRDVIASRLQPSEKLLLITLLEFRRGDTLTQATLADYLHVTERRVRQLIAGLVQSGVITRHRIRREARYSVRGTHRLLCRG